MVTDGGAGGGVNLRVSFGASNGVGGGGGGGGGGGVGGSDSTGGGIKKMGLQQR